MANLGPLAALFRLRPERAADYLAAKGFKLSGPYWELDGPQHSHLFTVANLAKLDVLTDIRSAVQQALDEGKTEQWFADQLVEVLKRKGWWGGKDGSLRRLHTIYATNLQTALMAGRHRQALEQQSRAPWAQYMAIKDHRSRPAHAALHGQVFRLDSPAWAAISPPNGYNCRCSARYLSDRELEKRGLKPAEDVRILEREPPGKRPVNSMTGDSPQRWVQRGVSVPSQTNPGERDILWADPGWDHIPGSTGAERRLVDRLVARADELSSGVREVVLADLAARGADFARAAVAAKASKQTAYIMAPTMGLNALPGLSIMDPGGLSLALDHDYTRHALHTHGSEKTETARGQRAITPADFAKLPQVLEAAISIVPGDPPKSANGAPRWEVMADFDGERWTVVLEVRRKQGMLVPYTLWIK